MGQLLSKKKSKYPIIEKMLKHKLLVIKKVHLKLTDNKPFYIKQFIPITPRYSGHINNYIERARKLNASGVFLNSFDKHSEFLVIYTKDGRHKDENLIEIYLDICFYYRYKNKNKNK